MPDILRLIIPGFLCLKLFGGLTGKKFETATIWVWSAVISFVTVSIGETILSAMTITLAAWVECALFVSCAAAAGCAAAWVYQTKWFQNMIRHAFAVSVTDTALDQIIDWEHGSNAVVYLKSEDCMFLGHVFTVGTANDPNICLYAPIKYNLDGKELYSHEHDEDVFLLIPHSDIKYMKIVN